ncbi:hypothetical protein D3C76_1143690 [compost metagenome]
MRIGVGHAAEQRQLDGGLIELAGLQGKLCAVTGRTLATPEIDFVAGTEAGVEVIDGAVVAVRIQLAVAIAAQQFLPVGIERGLDLRQLRTSGDHRLRLSLAHPGDGGGQVVTAHPGLFDQATQLRAAKAVPPLLVVVAGAGGVRRLPGGGRRYAAVRALGRTATGAEQQAEGQHTQLRLHREIIHW